MLLYEMAKQALKEKVIIGQWCPETVEWRLPGTFATINVEHFALGVMVSVR